MGALGRSGRVFLSQICRFELCFCHEFQMRSLKPHPCVSPSFRWWQLHSHVAMVPCIPENNCPESTHKCSCTLSWAQQPWQSWIQPSAPGLWVTRVPSSVLMGSLRVVVNTREPRLKFRTAGDVLAWACLPLTSRPAPDWKIQHCRAAISSLANVCRAPCASVACFWEEFEILVP